MMQNSYLLRHFQVIGVGINTERGLLMARISEDTGEENPLQVHRLSACESMGSAKAIFSDVTGTLRRYQVGFTVGSMVTYRSKHAMFCA
ncbi:unnamed protein product [Dovyalis caffra]|uniref:Uncharacterized protein n=1 Tax=Dovyalis caffra TaxID=77055 RepID=A0AAV1QX27_9ROSI|nr:unnamed protein product [Dovyalis caffra]